MMAAMAIRMGLAIAAAPTARMTVIIEPCPTVRKVLPMPLATMAIPLATVIRPLNWAARYFDTLPALLMPAAMELKRPEGPSAYRQHPSPG